MFEILMALGFMHSNQNYIEGLFTIQFISFSIILSIILNLLQSSLFFANGFNGIQFIGWTGNKTTISEEDVLADVLTVPHPEDLLIEFSVNYKNESRSSNVLSRWSWSNSGRVELERVIYPFGRCLKLKIPSILKDDQVISLQIAPNITFMQSKNINRVKLYFKDSNFDSKILSSSFKPSNKEIDFSRRHKGSRIFRKIIVI